MDLKLLVILALKVSIFCMVFGFGLKATLDDLLYLIRRPGLLVRSLLAVFVIMPVVAVAMNRYFDFRLPVEAALIALAVSPLPPLIPNKLTKASGHQSYGIALMAVLALLSIVVVPLSIEILARVFHLPLRFPTRAVADVVLGAIILPLVAGMIVRAVSPRLAARIEKPFALVAKILLPLAVLVLLAATLSATGAAIGGGTILAIVLFVVVGLVVGHVMGRPEPEHSAVLALASASRHPAIALGILTTNFPNENFLGIILLYLIVSAIVVIPYTVWQRKRSAGTASARPSVA